MKTVHVVGVNIEKKDHIGFWNLYPFQLFKKRFEESGYTIQRIHAQTTQEIAVAALSLQNPEILIFRPSWTEKAEDVEKLSKQLRESFPSTILIMADPFDQTNTRFFASLKYLDAMLKYQCLRDRDAYLKTYQEGCYALERLKTDAGITVNKGWDLASDVEPGQQKKIVTGSFVVEPTLIKQTHSRFYQWRINRTKKDIDVFCHVSCGEKGSPDWYGKHRLSAIDKLLSIQNRALSVGAEYAGESRLPRKEYLSRLRRAKIIFAPLGWGEVTMRAYEAVANQCLLIQPDVSHMDIFPNIFIPQETYIPVKWDLSDLTEKCEYYLANDEARFEIIANAQEQFKAEYRNQRFVDTCLTIFEKGIE